MHARVLWLTKGLGRGGVERLLADMYPLVDASRFEVQVAYLLPWKDAHHADLEGSGARVTCLDAGRLTDVRWLGRLRRLILDQQVDLVHTHSPVPAVAARLATRGTGVPLVHTEHNVWSRYRPPTRLANLLTYRWNARVIAVSSTVANSIRVGSRPAHPDVTVIRHGTDLDSVVPRTPATRRAARAAMGLPESARVIGSVGNFTPKKDHQTLLHALAAIESATVDPHLVLVGSGPLEAELKKLAVDLGIGDRVTFMGSRSDVFTLLAGFDVFALSSRFEGFPIALVEAMASGVPVVTTGVGGIPEIVTDQSEGLIVPDGQPESLSAALMRVLHDPALAARLAQRGREAAQGVDLRSAVARTESIYDDVLAGRVHSGVVAA